MSEYRYTLTRRASDYGVLVDDAPERPLVWVMLNPSTADDTVDDPTIRRVRRFTWERGWDHLVVVNLFALRSPRPVLLRDVAKRGGDPVGPGNGAALTAAFADAHDVVVAWGAWLDLAGNAILRELRPNVEAMLARAGVNVWCLDTTATGAPRHPLYVHRSQRLRPWSAS